MVVSSASKCWTRQRRSFRRRTARSQSTTSRRSPSRPRLVAGVVSGIMPVEAVVAISTARPPLVGRQSEMATLLSRLEAAGRGEGGVVLVGGEPGIGKTRLMQALTERAAAQAWTVLVGRAYEAEGQPPYLPFVEALRDYIRTCPLDALG